MLPVSELVSFARTVTDDGSSPIALRAARSWCRDEVRFLRSSANHVFVCARRGGDDSVLRLRPARGRATEQDCGRIATLARTLAVVGAPVAPAVTTSQGTLTAQVPAGDGTPYVGTMFRAIAGAHVEGSRIDAPTARAWGRGLAQLHDAASSVPVPDGLGDWLDDVVEATTALPDSDLQEVGAALVAAVRELPTSPDVAGIVHGDPELDNVVWADRATPVFVDLDDAHRSWFGADVCFALRDFAERAQSPEAHGEPVAAFLAGYRECRPLTDEEIEAFPLFARAHALITLARLTRARDERVSGEWPEWARLLRARLDAVADDLRAALLSSSSLSP